MQDISLLIMAINIVLNRSMFSFHVHLCTTVMQGDVNIKISRKLLTKHCQGTLVTEVFNERQIILCTEIKLALRMRQCSR
jgi:hypothetical protein